MNLYILAKIEAHVPAVSKLVKSYRRKPDTGVRAAIINAALAAESRYLSREEVLYLAWLKADHDRRARELDDDLKRQWLEKQRRQRSPVGRPAGLSRQRAA